MATFIAVGGAVVADVFPPEQRGTASGLFMIPLLVGPIVGPLLGGGLAEAFGWRSTFIFLTVFGGGCGEFRQMGVGRQRTGVVMLLLLLLLFLLLKCQCLQVWWTSRSSSSCSRRHTST